MEKDCIYCCADNGEEGCGAELQGQCQSGCQLYMGLEALTFWKAVSKSAVVEIDLAILVSPKGDGLLCIIIRETVGWLEGTAQHTGDFGIGMIISDARNLKQRCPKFALASQVKNNCLTISVKRPYVFMNLNVSQRS